MNPRPHGSDTPTTGPGIGPAEVSRNEVSRQEVSRQEVSRQEVSGQDCSDDSLESVMADYLQRVETGQQPDVAQYLKTYPQHASELQSFFRNHQWLQSEPENASTLIGTQVGSYTIESEIARGGMGVVYRAKQQGLQRPVALKLISSGVLAGAEERRRFRTEAEAAARLQHPGIIAIHEIGSWQGYEYFSMPLIEGPTLQKFVDDPQFDDRRSATLVRDVAIAVAYAHRAGIVHRDLKPENILIGDNDRPLVADFGLAKWHREGTVVTRTGQVLGTPHYMSPEQACGRGESDASSDIYSIGAILYAMLTGVPPHVGNSPAEVLRSVLQDEPQLPRQIRREIPADLEKICLKAIHFEADLRYASADALADDLACFLEGEPTSAAESGLLDRMVREIRRDQHQSYFEAWGRTLVQIGITIFVAHVAIFLLDPAELGRSASFWTPRAIMLATIFVIIYRARQGVMAPRSVAERPVFSTWIGYLSALAVINLLVAFGQIAPQNLFPLSAILSGFGFIAMAGHVWGGAAILGLGFLLTGVLSVLVVAVAPLLFGLMWLLALLVLARHYRTTSNKENP